MSLYSLLPGLIPHLITSIFGDGGSHLDRARQTGRIA